jgi:hypothetical protein
MAKATRAGPQPAIAQLQDLPFDRRAQPRRKMRGPARAGLEPRSPSLLGYRFYRRDNTSRRMPVCRLKADQEDPC